jgi:rare lipoprotein A
MLRILPRLFVLLIMFTACSAPASLAVIQEGTASWYGPGFHGKKTASGETYDSGAFTAAHKTLPLGTKVKVVNTKNGRSVMVRINDRGPYVSGRIIDLSKAAAEKLDMTRTGTAPVKLLVEQSKSAEKLAQKASATAEYTVQMASYNVKKQAEEKAKTYPDGWISQTTRDGRTIYRVCSGRFKDKAEAERQQRVLKGRGMVGFVKQLD